ncbi:RAD57-like protein [Saccharomyces kudriavzevii IFO 1802]|uniref:RAD57-like protein n=1 Tax=Saccharomyces kudriavzevii (strain ATCC MYA-4449 / AS 2.2408 / CBS 8840 / NBRC 1802 / NCYC 2889) TaxID=226230 RepID=J5PN23_SACK1|nr:RAD57-like protein [Saccharomyces kudriavzevii IFO 1802]
MDLYDELPESKLLCDEEFSYLLEAVQQSGVCVVDFLTLTSKELARLVQRSINEVFRFQQLLTHEYNEKYLDMCENSSISPDDGPKYFTTADVAIDELLSGGIFTHGITEIFGESSTGKSQLLMQLALSVQLSEAEGGLAGKCVYITTEGDLPTQRLESMLSSRPAYEKLGISQSNIFTVNCNDLINQEHIINVQLPILLERSRGAIKLVIVDSISHHLRVELQNKSFRESQENKNYLDKMAEKLQILAHDYSLAVVVANQVGDKPLVNSPVAHKAQVTDYDYQLGWLVGWRNSTILYRQMYSMLGGNPNNDEILSDDEDYMLIEKMMENINNRGYEFSTQREGSVRPENMTFERPPSGFINRQKKKRKFDYHVPNLGLTWSNHVSTRILLQKSFKASTMIQRGEAHLYRGDDSASLWLVKRIMKIVYSTFVKPGQIAYQITKRGIETA